MCVCVRKKKRENERENNERLAEGEERLRCLRLVFVIASYLIRNKADSFQPVL